MYPAVALGAKLPTVTTYCAFVCIAESFQSTRTELLLGESKPEGMLQEQSSYSLTAAQGCSAQEIKPELPQMSVLC